MDLDKDIYKSILDNLYDAVYFVDSERKITYWNKGAEMLTGYSAREVLGTYCYNDILKHANDEGVQLCQDGCPLVDTLKDGERREVEVYLRHKAGHRLPVHARIAPVKNNDGKIVGAVEIFNDNSKKFMGLEQIEELKKLALLDPLTSLGNRRFGEMQINAKLNEIKRYESSFGLVFIDIDNFDLITESFGTDVTDEVLKMASRTLSGILRSADMVFRWNSHQYMAIIAHVSSRKQLQAISNKVLALMRSSNISSGGDAINVTVSIGGIIASQDDTDETLIKKAEELMKESKAKGGNAATVRRDE